MMSTKETALISLDSLGIEECGDDKEMVSVLVGVIEDKTAELKKVKKMYKKALYSVFAKWKKEVEKLFPLLQFRSQSKDELVTNFINDGFPYEVILGKLVGKTKLICMVRKRLDLEDAIVSKFDLEDAIVSKFKDILHWTNGYCIFEEFEGTDLDSAFSCYITLLRKFEELTKE